MAVLALMALLLMALGIWRLMERAPAEERLQTVELHFGTDVTASMVEAMLAGIAGLPRAEVWLDAAADEHGITHYLHARPSVVDTLRSQWRGVLPTLRMDKPDTPPSEDWDGGVVLRLAGRMAVLRDDAPGESAAALLGALQPLFKGERLLVRWVLGSARRPWFASPPARSDRAHTPAGGLASLIAGSGPSPDHLRRVRAKYAGPVLEGVGMVSVVAGHPKRRAHLVSRVVSVVRSRGSVYGRVAARRRGAGSLPWWRGFGGRDRYAPSELVPLLGLPVGAPQVPGLTLGTAPVLLPSPHVPSTGRVLMASTWPGIDRILAQPVVGGLSHTLVAGPTGVGKSALITSLAVQDLQAGRGLLLLDGKGDTAEDVLARMPADRVDDVIVLDPGRGGPLPGLRVFGGGTDPQLTADLLLGVFADLFADSWGPLSSKWLRAGLLLLGHDRQATLADLPFVYSHDAFRRRLLSRVGDPLALATWAAFEAMGPAERVHQLSAPLNKIEEVIGRPVVRGVLAQAEPKLDMREVLREGRVVIVSLSAGKIGSTAARLIGALSIYQLFLAVQARAALAPQARKPFFAYVDEPKVLGDIPVPLDSLYELARGLGVGILLSAQSLSQLPAPLRSAATTNASTLIAFRQSADDAHLLARELPGASSEGLMNLPPFEVIARIGLGPGDVTRPVSGRTFPLPKATSDPEMVRRTSAERYGADPATVDAALAGRHTAGGAGSTPVGRVRRAA
jgi:hypothetical protein